MTRLFRMTLHPGALCRFAARIQKTYTSLLASRGPGASSSSEGKPIRRSLSVATVLCSVLILLAFARGASADPLIAKIDPRWSPFLQSTAKDPEGVLEEARKLLLANPARVSEVLGRAKLDAQPPALKRLARGLRADALYQVGGEALLDSQRGYRAILVDDPTDDEAAWANFQDANIKKILGFTAEARVAFFNALKGKRTPWRPAMIFNLAVMESEDGRFPQAASYLDSWLEENEGVPGTALVYFLLAEARSQTGEPEAALAAMDEGLRLGAEDWLVRPEIGYRLAEELKKANRMEEAVALLDKIAARYPGASTAAHARLLGGTFWEDLGKPELAARAYAELIDQKPTPDDEEAARLRLALLGVQYADTVNLTEPLPGYRDFYRPQPRLEAVFNGRNVERKQMALFGLAEYERKIGVPEKAIDMYISAFKQYPETPVSGRAYERFMDFFEERLAAENASGNYLKTIETYEKYKPFALWTTTRDVGGLSLRAAEAYRALGSPRLARTMYEDALLSGTRAAAHEELAQEILKTRVDQNEPEAYTAWLATHPDDIPIRLKLARSLKTQGNAEEARVEYRKAANSEKNQEAKLAILQEADLLLNQGDNVDERLKAVEDRRKILEKDKKAPPASAERITEARLLFAGGKHAEALKLLEKIENPGPEDRYLTGLCYRALGRNVEAKALFEKLVAEKADPLVADLAAMHLSVMSLQDVEASGRGVFPEPAKLQPKTTSAGAAAGSPKSPEAGKLK